MRTLKTILITFVIFLLTTSCTDNTEDLITNTPPNVEVNFTPNLDGDIPINTDNLDTGEDGNTGEDGTKGG